MSELDKLKERFKTLKVGTAEWRETLSKIVALELKKLSEDKDE